MTATATKKVAAPMEMSGDNILILPFPPPKEINGIALPDDHGIMPEIGRVIAAGPGLYGMTGYCPMEYKEGDIVFLFTDRPFSRVPIAGFEYFLTRQPYLKGKMTPAHPEYETLLKTTIVPKKYVPPKPQPQVQFDVPMDAGLQLPN